MILSLRRRHRVMMFSLAVILPIAFVAGLVIREPVPATPDLPVSLSPLASKDWQLCFEKEDHWPGLPITTRLYANRQSNTQLAMELQPRANLKAPDILVYCHPAFSAGTGQLPERAQLLGTLAGTEKRRFMLPAATSEQETSIILYSLAHQEIIVETKLPAVASLLKGMTP
jgi:hypothetical protein